MTVEKIYAITYIAKVSTFKGVFSYFHGKNKFLYRIVVRTKKFVKMRGRKKYK